MKEERKELTKKPKDKKPKKDSYNYCIPSPLSKFMSLVDDRTQMEASLLSMFLLLIGMMLFTFYIGVYSGWGWWMRGMTIFNGLCGMLFMFSHLVTTFQQYQSLRETQEIVGTFGTEEPFPQTKTKQIKPKDLKSKDFKLKDLKSNN